MIVLGTLFDDEFFEKQNIVISAVDNISARKYIDKLCVFYNKIFIDSGTKGTTEIVKYIIQIKQYVLIV